MQFAYAETNRTGTVGDRPTIDGVKIKWEEDSCTDLSHLERDSDDEYYEEDKARLGAYYQGEWHMAGCHAIATVSYPVDNSGNRRIETFTSGGLWGIESDSDKEFLQETEREQLEDLQNHLAVFGIDTSNFWELAGFGLTAGR